MSTIPLETGATRQLVSDGGGDNLNGLGVTEATLIPGNDGCYYSGAPFLPTSSVTGGLWTIGGWDPNGLSTNGTNQWGTDLDGDTPALIAKIRSHATLPCTDNTPQTMYSQTTCNAAYAYPYFYNTQKVTINASTVTNCRAGVCDSMKTVIFSALLLLAAESSSLFGQGAPPGRFWTAATIHHGKGSATIASSDPRPLWMAMNALEREYGWAIDFDDPVWGSTETTVQRNPQWESLHPGTFSRVPSGTHFQSTFAEDPTGIHSPMAIIKTIVDEYNKSGNPGRFEAHAWPSGHIEVIGHSQDSADSTLDLLATPVFLPAQNPTGSLEALNEWVNALSSNSGVRVDLGSIPFNLLSRYRVAIPQGPTSARDVLTLITDSGDVQLMWDLLYDFDSHSYLLNLKPRVLIKTDEIGNTIIVPQLKPKNDGKPQ